MKKGGKNKSVAFIILFSVITDHNDLHCLFTRCIASRRVNITMSVFVIVETQTTSTSLHCSKLAFESIMKTYLQAVSQKLVKLELLHFIETVFVHRSIVGYSSRFRTQSCVNCAAHTPIFGLKCSGTVL